MSASAKQLTAVILAGGKNVRFGGDDKAFMLIDGTPVIKVLARKLDNLFGEIVVVTNTPGRYAGIEGIVTVTDIIIDKGPLGGIHAAMKRAAAPAIFVVPCDMPFVDTDVIGMLITRYEKLPGADAVIPVSGGFPEPLHAIYRTGLAGDLENFLASSPDLSVRHFIAGLNADYIEMPDTEKIRRSFTNINTPGDLPEPG
ncbi:MAG: molybdenum cofactor guanylyltransferase [Marinilabiliales bacterium]|nr:MAG: molybdenum cofactor guanylyltransferase [Marinilabiliales bacterium]